MPSPERSFRRPEFAASLVPLPWLVIFDLDGTLIDSSQDLCASVNAALRYVGLPALSLERITSFIGNGALTLIRRAVEEASSTSGLPDANQDRLEAAFPFFLQYYREHKLDHTRLYPGVELALKAIREERPGLPMAVLTNKPVRPSREICQALGIDHLFFNIVGGDSLGSKKPEPEGLRSLVSEAAVLTGGLDRRGAEKPVSGVLLIGDSEVDVQTARAAGAKVLGCTYGLAPERLLEAQPDFICDEASEWPAWVCGLPSC